MAISPNKIFQYAFAMILIAVILPIALVYLGTMDVAQVAVNGTIYTVGDVVDDSILTMFMVIIPLVAGITITSYFMYKRTK